MAGEIETDKQHEDGADKEVEEAAEASDSKDGADDSDKEGADADDNKDDSDDSDEDESDEEETDEEEGADKDKKDDKKSDKSTSKKDDDEGEPPTRKRVSDFVKERQERRGNKAKSGDGDKAKKDSASDDEEGTDDDIDEQDEKTVGKIVERTLKPIVDKLTADEDNKEVSTFLKANPDFKPYEARARKYMAHPSRKDVPISEIFYGVAGKDLMALGAKRAKIANNEAKKTKTGGGAQDAGGVKSVAQMSTAEIEAKQNAVRQKLADR